MSLGTRASNAVANGDWDGYHRVPQVSINVGAGRPAKRMNAPNPLYLREEELDRGLELLYFAGRQLHADAAPLRVEGALDDTDHQLLFLVDRHPGATLADLCAMLGASKQTLSRHVKQLAEAELIEQGQSAQDRRKRPLRLTPKAAGIVARVQTLQKRRLRLAFKSAGAAAVEGFQRVLLDLVAEPRRHLLLRASQGSRAP